MLSRIRSSLAVACLLGLSCQIPSAVAQTSAFPAKPVKLVVAFSPGGNGDTLGRLMVDGLRHAWSQPMVIENRSGAAGNIAAEYVAKAPADGYTLLLNASSHVVNASLYKLPYDPVSDFSPIAEVAGYHYVLVARPSLGVKTVGELISLAKSKKGQLSMAHAGAGTAADLAGRLFMQAAGIEMTNVAYKGAGQAVTDIMGGHADAMFTSPGQVMPHVLAGKLLPLAFTGPKRFPDLPNVPTVAEAGFPGFEASTWFGVLGPAGIPRELVQQLNRQIAAAMKSPEVHDRLVQMGWYVSPSSVEQFEAVLREDREKWGKVIRDAGIKIE